MHVVQTLLISETKISVQDHLKKRKETAVAVVGHATKYNHPLYIFFYKYNHPLYMI